MFAWLWPFPPGAHRPVRGVLVYVAHELEETVRSPIFWITAVGFLVVTVGFSAQDVVTARSRPDLAVVAPPALAATLARAAAGAELQVSVVDEPPGARAWVRVEGDSVEQARYTLVIPPGVQVDGERRLALRLAEVARSTTLLTDDQRRRLGYGAPPPESRDLSGLVRRGLVGLIAFSAWFGALAGTASAQATLQARDQGFFHVLRLGNPVAVLYLGALLTRLALAGLFWLPLVALGAVAAVLSLGLMLLASPDQVLQILVGVPALAVVSGVTGFLVASSVLLVAGDLAGRGVASHGAQLVVQTALLGAPLLLLDVETLRPGPWLLLPAAGIPMAVSGLAFGLHPVWLVVSVAAQAPWALAAIRLGAWIYGLDEPFWVAARRALRWRR